MLVAVSVQVSDCNIRNKRGRKRDLYSSRNLELGQVYLRAKRKPTLNPKWADRISHSILCTPSILTLEYHFFFLGIFVFLCLTRPWLSFQSLCNWPAFTVSGPFPTSLSSSPFFSPTLLAATLTTQSLFPTYTIHQTIKASVMAPVSSSSSLHIPITKLHKN